MSGEPLVTVIVPTHDHASTIDLALDSVLAQSVTNLDVVVIGDGATDEVIDVLKAYPPDPRLRFIFRPKSASRGEEVRHEVLMAARSEFVAYSGDDDLLLPDHLAHMLDLLAPDTDFVHALPMAINRDGTVLVHPTDLAQAECRDWHRHPQRNCVSLTGVVHRVSSYRHLPHGWRPAPPDRWSDHYMWQQWFEAPGMTYRTAVQPTVLKFAAEWRKHLTPDQRRVELIAWRDRAAEPGFQDELQALVHDGYRRSAIRSRLENGRVQDDLELTAGRLTELSQHLDFAVRQRDLAAEERDLALRARDDAARERDVARQERDIALRDRDAMAATLTWRLHQRVTARPWVRRAISAVRRPSRRRRRPHR